MNKKAIVLLSGGMDSTVCSAIAKQEGYQIAALHVNYGQRTQSRELQSFKDVSAFYESEHTLVVDISHLSQIGGSSLTDAAMPVADANLLSSEIPSSYVPFRNANILAIATSWAEVIIAESIFIGAVQDDSSGYPDCRREFFDAFEQTIRTGTKNDFTINIRTPIINFNKQQIVEKGIELQVPFHLTWSCYKSELKACGVCDSCALRLRGFKNALAIDPIEYEVRPEYT